MVKDGQKVQTSMAYGVEAEGGYKDVVFETVDNRYRYTVVLVGLPAEQYQTEFAFRGYMILEKDGQETCVYGPVVTRSIYTLAKQVLASDSYEEDSSAYAFLQQLIADADALNPPTE